TILPIINVLKSNAIAAKNVPTVKMLIAVVNNCLVVNLSIKNAVTGIMIPFTNIKMVVNHCPVLALTPISSIIGGSAVIIVVWFKIEINPPDKSKIIIGLLPEEFAI